MSAVIRLDKSKPYSECHGERQLDDPHYKVHYWQGQTVGKDIVLLPFDANGILVPDDGKTQPYDSTVTGPQGQQVPVKHPPLYTPAMRALLERKMKKLSIGAKAAEAEEGNEEESDEMIGGAAEGDTADDVNFPAFLRGEVRYTPHVLRDAALKRYNKKYPKIQDLIVDLILDEKIVPETEVCAEFRRLLPAAAA